MLKNLIHIDENSGMPKYRQLINSIYQAIDNGLLKKGDRIPSLNQICTEFNLSRDTVMVAFNELKAKGVINSIPGKGYYIESVKTDLEQKVFVLFDELNVFKEDLYNSFLKHLDDNTSVDIFFHHFNFQFFSNLINQVAGKYTSYIVMPASFEDTAPLLSQLPSDRVIILDRKKEDLAGYPVIYQDFEADVYELMVEGHELLKKYSKLCMVFTGGKEPVERVKGFERFCKDYGFPYEIIRSLDKHEIKEGEAYFVTSDRNLVKLVNKATEKDFALGRNFGIISFNDTVLKQVVAGGITTISTDFVEMGKSLAKMISSKKKEALRNPSMLIVRASM
ncbi:MAG: GntR family transcriptional regulator [Bacteroidota bacterium]|nr:GntR family transcriptional regulator [Bacteroidota bacterium]MDP4206037.1 GntR family transcriptional regulator [Bacteroidota bacterium]